MRAHDKAALMAYCRVDDDAAGDTLVELSYTAAEYLSSAGVEPTDSNESRYTTVIRAMTLHYYDNPVPGAFPAGLQSMINQLKLTSMVEQ